MDNEGLQSEANAVSSAAPETVASSPVFQAAGQSGLVRAGLR